jgi:hypothetical protein
MTETLTRVMIDIEAIGLTPTTASAYRHGRKPMTDTPTHEVNHRRLPYPDCNHSRLHMSDGVRLDCDNCDTAVLRIEVGKDD